MNRYFLITILNILIGGLLMYISLDLSLLINNHINNLIGVVVGSMLIMVGAGIGIFAAYGYPLIGRSVLGRTSE